MQAQPRHRKHTEVLTSHLALEGADFADVGCGQGSLTHYAARKGARAIGLDCSQEALRNACSDDANAGAIFLGSLGEALPLKDHSLDIVLYFNSLHHVPVGNMESALAEAGRVLRAGGTLYVAEPLAAGPHFELVRAVEDETDVRAAAYAALSALRDRSDWRERLEDSYTATVVYESFESFCERLLLVDADRRDTVESLRPALEERFARLGRTTEKGTGFDQPMRINLFTRVR